MNKKEMKKIFITMKWEYGELNGYIHAEELPEPELKFHVFGEFADVETVMVIKSEKIKEYIIRVSNGGRIRKYDNDGEGGYYWSIYVNCGCIDDLPPLTNYMTFDDGITIAHLPEHSQLAFFETELQTLQNRDYYAISKRKFDLEHIQSLDSNKGWSSFADTKKYNSGLYRDIKENPSILDEMDKIRTTKKQIETTNRFNTKTSIKSYGYPIKMIISKDGIRMEE